MCSLFISPVAAVLTYYFITPLTAARDYYFIMSAALAHYSHNFISVVVLAYYFTAAVSHLYYFTTSAAATRVPARPKVMFVAPTARG
jgi:hypothetical protein